MWFHSSKLLLSKKSFAGNIQRKIGAMDLVFTAIVLTFCAASSWLCCVIFLVMYTNKMASASSTSARSLFVDSKLRLADRVQVNVNNIASVARQINRGSKSSEILFHTAKTMALQEHAMDNTEENLKKLQLAAHHLTHQQEALQRSVMLLDDVKEQVRAMQR